MIVLNPIWEKEKIPGALRELVKNLSVRYLFQFVVCIRFTICPQEVKEYPTNQGEDVKMPTSEETGPSLEERKLEYVHLANGVQPRSQTSVSLITSTSLLLLNSS